MDRYYWDALSQIYHLEKLERDSQIYQRAIRHPNDSHYVAVDVQNQNLPAAIVRMGKKRSLQVGVNLGPSQGGVKWLVEWEVGEYGSQAVSKAWKEV